MNNVFQCGHEIKGWRRKIISICSLITGIPLFVIIENRRDLFFSEKRALSESAAAKNELMLCKKDFKEKLDNAHYWTQTNTIARLQNQLVRKQLNKEAVDDSPVE